MDPVARDFPEERVYAALQSPNLHHQQNPPMPPSIAPPPQAATDGDNNEQQDDEEEELMPPENFTLVAKGARFYFAGNFV